MKNKVLLLAAMGMLSLAFTSCGKKDSATTTEQVAPGQSATEEIVNTATDPDTTVTADPSSAQEGAKISATGEVTEVTNGKDGVMAKIKATDGKIYTATISIPNLEDPKKYRAVKVGETIAVSGDAFMLGEEQGIVVRDLK